MPLQQKSQLVPKKLIIAEFLIGKIDQQRPENRLNAEDIVKRAKVLSNSTKKHQIPVYVLTDADFSYQSEYLKIVYQSVPKEFNRLPMYFMRWMMAYQFLFVHPEIEEVFFVDLGDVEMMVNPFGNILPNRLYMGDENVNMTSGHFTDVVVPDYARKFFDEHWYLKVLDPGIIGGKRAIVLEYLGVLVNLMAQTFLGIQNGTDKGLQSFEMAIINYAAYRYFPTRIKQGRQVSTIVFQNRHNEYSWFKHK